MAVVLHAAEELHYFNYAQPSTSSAVSSLRHSCSQSRLPPAAASSSMLSRSRSSTNLLQAPPDSSSSSTTSSPRTLPADSSVASYASTPATTFSLDPAADADGHHHYGDNLEDDDIISFPSYDEHVYPLSLDELEPLPKSYTVSTPEEPGSESSVVSLPDSPVAVDLPQDDIQLRVHPTRHVDYLSHDWKEEEISASWRHIVSRRGQYNNSARLENASWRTWAKTRASLQTVSAEQLNWLKDCDVTWLYGPLQLANARYHDSTPSAANSHLSKSSSFLRKKPILKKRSMSEIMLQRSLSSSSLLKQATASIHAQQSHSSTPRPGMSRETSDYIDFSINSRRPSHDQTATRSSLTSSGLESPASGERKHIHFNEQVEQCIALEIKGEGDDDELDAYNAMFGEDSDSDDGAIMMKRSTSARRLPPMPSRKVLSRSNSSSDGKTIAMLPSTTLKYREDTPEPDAPQALRHSSWTSRLMSPSPSQETLRPSKPSSRLLLGDDDDDDIDWQPPQTFLNRKDSIAVTHDRLQLSDPSQEPGELHEGLRRTSSGMFMPLEQDEDDIVAEGLFGKVVEAANTAKDIAHVIWNVGWRR